MHCIAICLPHVLLYHSDLACWTRVCSSSRAMKSVCTIKYNAMQRHGGTTSLMVTSMGADMRASRPAVDFMLRHQHTARCFLRAALQQLRRDSARGGRQHPAAEVCGVHRAVEAHVLQLHQPIRLGYACIVCIATVQQVFADALTTSVQDVPAKSTVTSCCHMTQHDVRRCLCMRCALFAA